MKCKLGDIVEVTMGQSPKSEFYNADGKGTPFLQGNRTFGSKYPTFDTFTTFVTKQGRAGDVIMSVRAPVGDVNITPVDICLGRGVCSLRMKNGNQEFLYYMMRHYAQALINRESGTVFGSVNKNDVNGLDVEVPSEETQRKIAAILSALDDKIELNRRINANLEQQAAAIYSNMFVENVAPSWRQGKLAEIITVKYGKDHKKLGDGIYPVFGSGGIMRYVERPLYNRESVLIPRKGTLNNVLYVDEPFWSVDTMFYTEMRLPNIAKYVYHFVKEKDLASMNAGSAVPSMTTDILNALEITIPSPDALKKFEDTVGPMFSALRENNKQNAKLAAVRDALLPRLMSGEIDVSCLNI